MDYRIIETMYRQSASEKSKTMWWSNKQSRVWRACNWAIPAVISLCIYLIFLHNFRWFETHASKRVVICIGFILQRERLFTGIVRKGYRWSNHLVNHHFLSIAYDLDIAELGCVLNYLISYPISSLRPQLPIHHQMLKIQSTLSLKHRRVIHKKFKCHKLQAVMYLRLDLEVPRISFLMLTTVMRSIIAFPTASLSTRMVSTLTCFITTLS